MVRIRLRVRVHVLGFRDPMVDEESNRLQIKIDGYLMEPVLSIFEFGGCSAHTASCVEIGDGTVVLCIGVHRQVRLKLLRDL